MKILITGANGMVARAAAAYCHSIGDDVHALTRQDLDIADTAAVNRVVRELGPDAVLNCAAYTDVDGAESNAEAANAANVLGPANLAAVCRREDRILVTISTDYIFDGSNPGFYTQRDTPNPRGVYATTKYGGEVAARRINARSIVVRSGWIYGSGGTNFLSVMHKLLASGKTVKAISDAFGTPTFAGDLARRLRELAVLDLPCTFHVTNSGGGASYLDFADAVCEVGGFDRRLIEPIASSELQRPAPRPANSKLACVFSDRFGLAPLPDWKEALARFITNDG